MLRIRPLFRSSLVQPPRRLNSTQTFLQETATYGMRMLMVAIPAYGTYFYISMPIVGRSMSPQFNPQFADFGDTAFLLPRIQPQGKLHRGRVYVFTDPSKV